MAEMCDKIQRLGKGIANPVRYRLVQVLITGPLTVGELVTKVKLSQPAVSQHLRKLKACGLVLGHKNGQEVYYSLNAGYMVEILAQLTFLVSRCKNTSKSK